MTKPKVLVAAALAAVLAAGAAQAQAQDYTIKLVAGSPGYDHIQPFMAEHLKFWDKYGLKVDFIGGNYMRSNLMMAIGDFDVGYNQLASAIRYNSAGIANIVVAPSSAKAFATAAPVPGPHPESTQTRPSSSFFMASP